ncbi:hypothetical protein FQZ97_841110 [compost metagenome]
MAWYSAAPCSSTAAGRHSAAQAMRSDCINSAGSGRAGPCKAPRRASSTAGSVTLTSSASTPVRASAASARGPSANHSGRPAWMVPYRKESRPSRLMRQRNPRSVACRWAFCISSRLGGVGWGGQDAASAGAAMAGIAEHKAANAAAMAVKRRQKMDR